MFFSQEDYKKIQLWLQKNAIKDTEFNDGVLPLNGEETIALVQNKQNIKVFLKDFIAQLALLGSPDFINISDKFGENYISLSQAIKLIPYRSRKIGQVITFLDEFSEYTYDHDVFIEDDEIDNNELTKGFYFEYRNKKMIPDEIKVEYNMSEVIKNQLYRNYIPEYV